MIYVFSVAASTTASDIASFRKHSPGTESDAVYFWNLRRAACT